MKIGDKVSSPNGALFEVVGIDGDYVDIKPIERPQDLFKPNSFLGTIAQFSDITITAPKTDLKLVE